MYDEVALSWLQVPRHTYMHQYLALFVSAVFVVAVPLAPGAAD